MKPECEKCPMKDKSPEACRERRCKDSDYVPPYDIPYVPPPEPHISSGKTIEAGVATLEVYEVNKSGFVAQIRDLDDKKEEHGHYGSYITEGRYYQFDMTNKSEDDCTWIIPDEGTERFHREGRTGAQLILYWQEEIGYSLDLDS